MLVVFKHVLVLSLMASTVANFWTLCLVNNMIFGELGNKIRAHLDFVKERDGGFYGWNKLLKGLQCPYCTSIWIIIVIQILYFNVIVPGSIGIGLQIFYLFMGMGLTTLVNKLTSVFINQNLEL